MTESELQEFLSKTTFQQIHKRLSDDATTKGEWAGCPLPIPDYELVIEPKSPYAHLNGVTLNNPQGESGREPGSESGDEEFKIINHWYSRITGIHVYIVEDEKGKRNFYKLPSGANTINRLEYIVNLLGITTTVWDENAELKAVQKLKHLITPHAFKCYFMTGSFLETSKKSNVTYLFRRSKPTIAISNSRDYVYALTTLCLHPIGYYRGTWAGTMVPTDDVIAHLLTMRGDEHFFWRKANHHSIYTFESGI